jgi:hypothetical protein
VDCRGQHSPRKEGRPKKGEEKQASDKPKGEKKDYDKAYFKDLPCFKRGKKGHPQLNCPTKDNDYKNSSIFTKLSRTSKLDRKPKIKDFKNQFKNLKKSFAQLKLSQEDNLASNSSEEMSHF